MRETNRATEDLYACAASQLVKIAARICSVPFSASKQLAMEGVDSKACYVLMEDNAGLAGRCMTLPQASSSNGRPLLPPPPPRTATFSGPLLSRTHTAAPPAPAPVTGTQANVEETVFAENVPIQPRVAVKTGILRQSVALDGSDKGHPRIKKHVSINLPESPQHKLASRRRYKRSATVDGIPESGETGSPADEVVVHVDMHYPAESPEGIELCKLHLTVKHII